MITIFGIEQAIESGIINMGGMMNQSVLKMF